MLRAIAIGKSNKEIGSVLGISEGTVKVHVTHILEKLKAGGRTEAINFAVKRGLVHIDGDRDCRCEISSRVGLEASAAAQGLGKRALPDVNLRRGCTCAGTLRQKRSAETGVNSVVTLTAHQTGGIM